MSLGANHVDLHAAADGAAQNVIVVARVRRDQCRRYGVHDHSAELDRGHDVVGGLSRSYRRCVPQYDAGLKEPLMFETVVVIAIVLAVAIAVVLILAATKPGRFSVQRT